MAKRDLEILAACVIALGAFNPAVGLTGAADISHLTVEEIERGEHLLDTLTEAEVAAALRDAEALCRTAEVVS